MNLRDFQDQLIRDLKRSWAKTAMLGLLLFVGMALWLPPLIKSISGSSSPSLPTAPTKPSVSITQMPGLPKPDVAPRSNTLEAYSWTKADDWLRSDPSAKPAEMSQVRTNPFRLDRDQFPPPILFEVEPPPASERPATGLLASASPSAEIKGAVLTSTIVSESRRAALINDKLYSEGSQFKLEGQTFAVERIFPDRVKLTQDGVVYYLTIPSRYEINQ